MKYELDDIIDILFDGSESQIRGLSAADCDGTLEYSYDPQHGAYTVFCGSEGQRGHGLITPNCVAIFGNKHTFSVTSSPK